MIPYVLIVVGGVMILAGVKKESPLAILKSVLTNTPIPDTTGNLPSAGSTAVPPGTNPSVPPIAPPKTPV